MKRTWLFIALLLLFGIRQVLTAQKNTYVKYVSRNDAEKKVFLEQIKKLLEAGQLDSALNYCSVLRKNDQLSYDDLEKAQATIYWYKGDKNTAYQYVLNSTEYLIKNAGSQVFSNMLYDYDYAYPLATDSFLEQIIIHKIEDFYLKQDFAEAATGYKLIQLDYKIEKCMARYKYDLQQTADTIRKELFENQYRENLAAFRETFLNLIKQLDHLLTWKEAGSGFQAQYAIIRAIADDEMHSQLAPYFEKAYQDKGITPEVYVNELVLKSHLADQGFETQSQLRDSLCKIFNCTPVVKRIMVTKNGDTLTYSEPVKTPQNGSSK